MTFLFASTTRPRLLRSPPRLGWWRPLRVAALGARCLGLQESRSQRHGQNGILATNCRDYSRFTATSTTKSKTPTTTTAGGKRPLFSKILVANRGEIACRVIKTAKKLGIRTVAVYSEADRHSMHVQMADEAYLIGPALSSESYLQMDKIISVAKLSGAQAIHPGYGFLSENSAFAEKVKEHGLVFIGPPVSAIISMGSKSASKEIMSNAGVPVVPGYFGENQDPAFLAKEAEKIGYPVLIKAVKGGGGKGMRIVDSPEEFQDMLSSAQSEAKKSFGDERVLVEKYITRPRHVEVQVFGDTLDNYVYLFERDCSVQRRHQKIIEEAPAPHLSEELRKSFGEKAVAAARAVQYVGAGTVEFILDEDTGAFYFMEMNTRLQVEHPVTEMITKTDLVEWQLEVASGNRLPQVQEELERNGWAFEARIYAENPDNNFLPDTGPLRHLRFPEPSETVRVETGVRQGDAVSVYYDPMISKLVVWGPNREDALNRLRNRLSETEVVGLKTNVEFLKRLSAHPSFIKGEVDTGFIKRFEKDLFPEKGSTNNLTLAVAALGTCIQDLHCSSDPWDVLSGLRLNFNLKRNVKFIENEKEVVVEVEFNNGSFDITVNGSTFTNVRLISACNVSNSLTLEIDSRRMTTTFVQTGTEVTVSQGVQTVLKVPAPTYSTSQTDIGGGSVKTPMPCKISQVMVQAGHDVKKGQPLIVLEAMKMEHIIRSPRDGKIKKVNYKVGDLVGEGKQLVSYEDAE